jgi:hypothetical protein
MSNLPNITNYEEWLINHLEGLLNEAETALLMDFLSLHPAIKAELDLLSQTDLALEINEVGQDFSYLKKEAIDTLTPTQENQLIALLEGDLSESEVAAIEREIAIQPAFKKAYNLFELTKLKPSQIEFKGKDKLKRKKGKRIALIPMQWIAVAATLLIVGYGSWILFNTQQYIPSNLANADTNIVPKEIPLVAQSSPQGNTATSTNLPHASKSLFKEELLVSKATLQHNTINPLSLKANLVDLALPELQVALVSTLPNYTAIETLNEPKFLKPSEWLVQKIKKNIPEQALAAVDTISKGGAGHLALDMLNKTTGISMESYAKEDDPRRRVAFVSKYFSYERVTYQKN